MRKKAGLSTRAVHSAEEVSEIKGSILTPIYQSSTFAFNDVEELYGYLNGKSKKYFYSRYGNPTVDIAGKKIAELEGRESGLVFSSGMSAITTSVLSFCQEWRRNCFY